LTLAHLLRLRGPLEDRRDFGLIELPLGHTTQDRYPDSPMQRRFHALTLR
jgi:hypothetical protein